MRTPTLPIARDNGCTMIGQMSRESLCASTHNYCELALLRCAPTLAPCGGLAKGTGDGAADFVAGTSNESSDWPSCVKGGSALYIYVLKCKSVQEGSTFAANVGLRGFDADCIAPCINLDATQTRPVLLFMSISAGRCGSPASAPDGPALTGQ